MADESSCGRRRHWSEAEKRRMVADWAESGLTLAVIARRYAVSPSCLGRWRRQFGDQTAPHPVFVPVEVAAPVSPAPKAIRPVVPSERAEAVVEIILNGGRRLRVDADIAPARLRLLVAAVEQA